MIIYNLTDTLIIGQLYWVPCVYWKEKKRRYLTEKELWGDRLNLSAREIAIDSNGRFYRIKDKFGITPIYDHPHNDKENGQNYVHYHQDTRFEIVKSRRFEIRHRARITLDENLEIGKVALRLVRLEEVGITPASLIAKSKLKYNCIHKGKCPHRGYDLTNTPAINGVITCPLHGLKFDAQTLKIIVWV